jgi:enamine deaminase RidA (YjgF/YER057c/UK114 family)
MDAGATRVEDPARLTKTSVQQAGPRVYISGQAEAAPDLAEATIKTLQSLEKTLLHLGLNLRDVVQIKSFLSPMARVDEARRAIEEFYRNQPVPPLVFVEWSSSLPIEIELIATSPRGGAKEPIEFITPPGMTASPVFCRVTRVNAPETIFISGLYGPEGVEPAQEVEEIFGSLRKLLASADSDQKHLAKATYYVTSDDASNRLNEIRPKLYDPARPPAASKAMVTGTGMARRRITLDMIAVKKPAMRGE